MAPIIMTGATESSRACALRRLSDLIAWGELTFVRWRLVRGEAARDGGHFCVLMYRT